MNMKTLAVLVLMGLSYAAFAQEADEGNKNPPRSRGQGSKLHPVAQNCVEIMASPMTTRSTVEIDGQSKVETRTVESVVPDAEKKKCDILAKLSQSAGSNIQAPPEESSTAKNEMTCKRTAGFTLDFVPCAMAVKALNTVVNTEAALLLAQQVRTDVKQKNIMEQTNKQIASGDGVGGVYDASIAQNQHLKSMEQEKALAYSAAVAALGATYAKWPKEEKLLQFHCGKLGADAQTCTNVAKGLVADNEQAKGVLAQKITEYIAKGLAAGIKMGQFNTRAEAVEKAKDSLNPEDEDAMIERCMFNPTDPLCATPGNRVAGPSYGGGGDFSLGDGGNNSFDMGEGNNDFGEEGSAPTIDDETVAGTNSPFEDAAKAANDILDPAAAASMQPGSAPGAGGGGVGGGGGGGSASLGGDLEGAEKDGEKDPSLKTSKSSGNYAFGAGGGYQAVKGGKDDANPFASLFDSKSSGGLEEDRSIASASDGPGSGLFQRISKRYSEVQSQKRIEANNLE